MSGNISKAFLLAAGFGTRLRPVTNRIPKCLVPIHGQPLLSLWLDFCEKQEISEVLINTHHFANQVQDWAANQKSAVRVTLSHEAVLRGSAGTLAANRKFVGDDTDFYVFYADNLVTVDLAGLRALHEEHSGALTMGLFRTPRPENCGIVTLGPSAEITSFEEKPSHPRSDLAFAGIVVARTSLFDFIPRGGFADLGKDVMPKLVGDMRGRILDGYIVDIGTPENYKRALSEWPSVLRARAGMVAGESN